MLVGDPAQIDNPYVDRLSNGLVYTRDRLRDESCSSHVTLERGERSPVGGQDPHPHLPRRLPALPGRAPGEILLLTFTNKAAKEMLHRVHDLTGIEPQRFWGGTFHSIGQLRALRMFGDAIGLPRTRGNFTILDRRRVRRPPQARRRVDDKTFDSRTRSNPRPRPALQRPLPRPQHAALRSTRPSSATSRNTARSATASRPSPPPTRRRSARTRSPTTTTSSSSG